MNNLRSTYLIRTVLVFALIIAINVVANFSHLFIDLTEDKRFTLSDSTIELVDKVDNTIYIRVLLDGEFPAGFKRLKAAVAERLDQFRSENSLIEYAFEDPSQGSVSEINDRRQRLKEMGIAPRPVFIQDGSQRTEKLIYPYAIINYADRTSIVNLLEEQGAGISHEIVLNNSINLLEFKLASGLEKLLKTDRPNIVISSGHGELEESVTAKLESELRPYYDIGRINLDSLYELKQEADLLIIPAPRTAIREKTQFVIDQYLMNGGKIIWMIENLEVNLDSINGRDFYVPKLIEHSLHDLLFKYGVRIDNNLILDLECSQIPQVIGMQGGKPQTSLFPWYYHPVVAAKTDHPIVKNMDRVNMKFPSSINVLDNKLGIESTVLLSSSEYSRFQIYPMRLNFEILRIEPDVTKFNKGPLPVAVLLEGEFESYFKNRITQANKEVLDQIGTTFKEKSGLTKQIIISDADFVKNLYDANSGKISPIGYNKWEQNVYAGNASFIRNSIDFMLDDFGLLESRSKDFKLRLLDKVKTNSERTKWQIINLVLPIVIVWLFAFLYSYWRKKRFT